MKKNEMKQIPILQEKYIQKIKSIIERKYK